MKEVLDKENQPTWKRKRVRHDPPPTTRKGTPTKKEEPTAEEKRCAGAETAERKTQREKHQIETVPDGLAKGMANAICQPKEHRKDNH